MRYQHFFCPLSTKSSTIGTTRNCQSVSTLSKLTESMSKTQCSELIARRLGYCFILLAPPADVWNEVARSGGIESSENVTWQSTCFPAPEFVSVARCTCNFDRNLMLFQSGLRTAPFRIVVVIASVWMSLRHSDLLLTSLCATSWAQYTIEWQ